MLVLEHILYLIVDRYVGATGNIRSVVGGLKKINKKYIITCYHIDISKEE